MEQLALFPVVHVPLYGKKGNIVAYALVDSCDWVAIQAYSWKYLHAGKGYAFRSEGSKRFGTYELILMHREILGLPRKKDGREVDHRNRNGLDNRRENMRILTHAQNLQNRSAAWNSTSIYRGVYWDKKGQRWRGIVTHNQKNYHLGSFLTEEAANQACIAARVKLFPYTIEN